jgi:hypothetical protein
VTFITPGTYQFYSRHSMYDNDGNGNFGNEDSIYVSPAFNLNSNEDWIGFEGLEYDNAEEEFFPLTANSANDGWYAIRDWGVESEGEVEFNNDASTDFWNGNFHWYNRPFFVSANEAGGFDDDFGFKTEYIVTEEQVGQTLTFEIGTREPYGVFDGFLFIQDDEVNLLEMFSQQELTDAILSGDAGEAGDLNDDGEINFGDLTPFVMALTDIPAYEAAYPGVDRVARCDVSGDGMCNFGDLTPFADLLTGGPGSGSAVPEPASAWLLVGGLLAWLTRRRR